MSSSSIFVHSSLYQESRRVYHFVVVLMPSFMFSKKDVAGDEFPTNTVRRNEIGTPSTPGTNDGVNNDCLEKYFEPSKSKKIFKFVS